MNAAFEGVVGALLVGVSIMQANSQHPETAGWWTRGKTLILGIGSVWMVLSVGLTMAPVVRDISATVAQISPGRVQARMTGVKVRDCRWLGSDAYVIDSAGTRHEAQLTWIHDASPGSSKRPGRYEWDPAMIEYDPAILAAQVEIVSDHSCRWMWHDVLTTAGPWHIPR